MFLKYLTIISLDVDYSPTGEEIVTGSYDRSIIIFDAREGHSRDIYHTKRMQRYEQLTRKHASASIKPLF